MYKNSKRLIFTPILLAVGIVLGIFLGQFFSRTNVESQIRSVVSNMGVIPTNKLSYTLSLINNSYIDSVSMDSLYEQVIPLLVKELDPHSTYIPASELQRVNEPLQGEFDGIGVVFNMMTDTVIVLNVIPSGPSHKAGVNAGDRIIHINDSLVAGVKYPQNDVVKLLRGKRGTSVKLSLERRGISELVEIDVIRDVIPMESVEASLMISDSTGYIKLSQFARTSQTEILQALSRLRGEGLKNLILDLRGNPGGYLDQAIHISNEFMHKDELLVYTEDRDGKQDRQYADGLGTAQDIDLAILIDEGSASSSEILAGALQDNDHGVIIGRRSFGKGLVQQQIPFSDGSALRLTIAQYFTPTGRSIQKPYTVGAKDRYDMEIVDRYKNNELFSADSIHFADSLKRITPKGKIVYGGGGIMPDIFVPADTTDITRYFIEVTGRNILYRYTMEYTDTHREELNKIVSLPALKRFLDNDRTMVDDFIRYAKGKGVAPNYRDIDISHKLIKAQLRAYIGRNTPLEDDAFYANIYVIDNVVLKAIEILNMPAAEIDGLYGADMSKQVGGDSLSTTTLQVADTLMKSLVK